MCLYPQPTPPNSYKEHKRKKRSKFQGFPTPPAHAEVYTYPLPILHPFPTKKFIPH